ncbi:diguanylate cyclase [Actinokineospora bangkokensis]|uniref:Diguanylate cyclase n=1 Tax=Actinokineospora bangkokensis TaxID=1193682 RepID=A0A1Q9LJV1_9PSEU|nr:diguanylate cyclase [Actinokineospora bangkokensis]
MGGAWLVYLLTGLALVVAYYFIPETAAAAPLRVVLYCALSGSAAVAACWGAARTRPGNRLPWVLIGASQVVYFTADSVFYIGHYLVGVTAFPSWPDLFYLGHYPFAVLGVLLLIRRRAPGRDLPGVLDAATLGVVAAMLSWVYLIGPQSRRGAPVPAELASVAYPVMDLALLTVALGLLLGSGARPRAFFLLVSWLALILSADTIYIAQQVRGVYEAGNFLDAIWLCGNLALGAAALHPTVDQVSDTSPMREGPLNPVRIAVLSGVALLAPLVLMVQYYTGDVRDVPVVAGACAALFLLTITRLALLVSDQRRLAITDVLTGLHTRRFFEAQLPLEMARARRSGGSVAVLIIDVDHFKSINDRYGHPAGDRVLVEIAARLRSTVRSGEVLARHGGEEFALIVPGADAETLPALADRLREQVASAPVVVTPQRWVAVTVSIGTARFPTHGTNPADLVAIADRALYSAKAAGRDRVVVASDTTTAAAVEAGERPDPAGAEYLHRVADAVDDLLDDHGHSRAVARWARMLATEFGYDADLVRRAELAGRLHDVGKILLPRAVLVKPGELDEAEWALVRMHPEHGFRMTALLPGHLGVAHVIRQHHERWDGRGYPDRLAGRDIRVEARIVAVCDSWAAMRSQRPYQPAMPVEQAREEVHAARGTQFDPDVADAFLELHQRGAIADVHLVHRGPS